MRNKLSFQYFHRARPAGGADHCGLCDNQRPPSPASLVGTWKMTIPQNGSSSELTEALQTYFADGNFIETNNNSQAGSTAHGAWIGAGNTYLNMFQVFTFDEEGKSNGKRVIHASIKMDGADHYTANFVTDSIDVAGEVTKKSSPAASKAPVWSRNCPKPTTFAETVSRSTPAGNYRLWTRR